jgi:hypothetical protein
LILALHSAANASYLGPQTGPPFATWFSMSSRTELELMWQGYVRSAQQRYEEECQAFDRVATDFRERFYQSPDGGEALRLARHRQSLALKEYMRTLRIYTDLVLKGVVPEEPPNSNRPPA